MLVLVVALYTGVVDCLQPMICQYYAERNYLSIRKTMILGTAYTVAISLLVTFFVSVAAPVFPFLFAVNNPELVSEIIVSLRVFLLFLVFFGMTLILSNYYIYIEKRNYGFFLKTLLLIVFPLVGMVVSSSKGIIYLWLGIGLGYGVAFLLNYLLVKFWLSQGDLLLQSEEKVKQFSYDIDAVKDEVMALSYRLKNDLKDWDLSSGEIMRLSLLTEEIGLHAVERAKGKPFQLEFSFMLDKQDGKGVKVIVRDNGNPYDLLAIVSEGKYS